MDYLFPASITLFEETLFDADPNQDLHVMLYTLGGDGETALRLVRQAQSRCKNLTVIVPDQAKSAGTLFVLGADRIFMGRLATWVQLIRNFASQMARSHLLKPLSPP